MDKAMGRQMSKYSTIVVPILIAIWLFLYLVLPTPFKGPVYVACHTQTTCIIQDTTRWHWLGGYHAAFGQRAAGYPAVMKYQPTSTREVWVLAAVSLAGASVLCLGALELLGGKHAGKRVS